MDATKGWLSRSTRARTGVYGSLRFSEVLMKKESQGFAGGTPSGLWIRHTPDSGVCIRSKGRSPAAMIQRVKGVSETVLRLSVR